MGGRETASLDICLARDVVMPGIFLGTFDAAAAATAAPAAANCIFLTASCGVCGWCGFGWCVPLADGLVAGP